MAWDSEPITRTVDLKRSTLRRRFEPGGPPLSRPQRVPKPAPVAFEVKDAMTLGRVAEFVREAIDAGTPLDALVTGVTGGDPTLPLLPLLGLHVDRPAAPQAASTPDRGEVKPTTITIHEAAPTLDQAAIAQATRRPRVVGQGRPRW